MNGESSERFLLEPLDTIGLASGLPIGDASIIEPCVGLTREHIYRQIWIRRSGLALHRHGHEVGVQYRPLYRHRAHHRQEPDLVQRSNRRRCRRGYWCIGWCRHRRRRIRRCGFRRGCFCRCGRRCCACHDRHGLAARDIAVVLRPAPVLLSAMVRSEAVGALDQREVHFAIDVGCSALSFVICSIDVLELRRQRMSMFQSQTLLRFSSGRRIFRKSGFN